MEKPNKNIVTANEFQLVDADGRLRGKFAATEQGVSFTMTTSKGLSLLEMMVDEAGLSFFRLYDQDDQTSAKVDVSVDSKGTHFFLAGEGKQQSYLFLKKGGASGVVLVDKDGNRRVQALVTPDGTPDVSVFPKNEDQRTI